MPAANYAPDDGAVGDEAVLDSGVGTGAGVEVIVTGAPGGLTFTLEIAPDNEAADYVAAGDDTTFADAAGVGVAYIGQGLRWRLRATGTAASSNVWYQIARMAR